MVEHNNHNHDDLSRLLDHALSSYVPEEPLGLSQRVLGRMQESIRSRQQRRAFRFAFAFAGLCLAVLAWIVIPGEWFSGSRLASHRLVPSTSLLSKRNAGQAVDPSPEHRRDQAAHPRTARRRLPGVLSASRSRPSFPKLDQFPAPTPLTNEERALLRVPAQTAAALLVSNRSSRIDPIDIKPLQIEPF